MSGGRSWITFFLVFIVLHWISREAIWQRAVETPQGIIFPPVSGVRVMYGLGVPLCGAGAVNVLLYTRSEWWVAVLFLFFFVFLFISWPGTIEVENSGISQTRWFGLRKTRLEWDMVESETFMDFENTTYVRGKDGATIAHTQFHVDPLRFRAELKKRSSVPLLNSRLQSI